MFNVGGGELLVILLVALIVLGPDKLPQAAKQFGRFAGEARKVADGFRREMKEAIDEADRTSSSSSQGRLSAPPTEAQPIETTTREEAGTSTASSPGEPEESGSPTNGSDGARPAGNGSSPTGQHVRGEPAADAHQDDPDQR